MLQHKLYISAPSTHTYIYIYVEVPPKVSLQAASAPDPTTLNKHRPQGLPSWSVT